MKKRTLRKTKNFLHTFLFITLPVLCFVGALSSTIAWYSFNASVSTQYEGTSISSTKQLQVGIKTDIDLSDVDLVTDNGIAWSVPGDGLLATQIETYLDRSGHASVELPALTTGEFHNGDDITLKYSPNAEIKTSVVPAEPEDYVELPLAFRVIKSSNRTYLPNQPIWLTDSYVGSNAPQNIGSGVRAYFKTNTGTSFVFHPVRDQEKGSMPVGGLMDLNFDGYYDAESDGKELIYGDYTTSGDGPQYHHIDEDTPLHDINETGATEPNTFYAKHKAGREVLDDYTNITFLRQNYETLKSIRPTDTETGFTGGLPVCITDPETCIATTDVTIWLEGWDHIVVDSVTGFRFNLSLTFQINRV